MVKSYVGKLAVGVSRRWSSRRKSLETIQLRVAPDAIAWIRSLFRGYIPDTTAWIRSLFRGCPSLSPNAWWVVDGGRQAEGRLGITRRVSNGVGPHTSDWRVPVGVSFGTAVPGHEGNRQQRLQVSAEDRPGELGYDPCTGPRRHSPRRNPPGGLSGGG